MMKLIKICLAVLVAYIVYEQAQFMIYGVSDPMALVIGNWVGTGIGYIILYGIVPMLMFKLLKKIVRKMTA